MKVLKESDGSFSAPSPAPLRPIRKNQDQQQTAAPTHAPASEIVPSSMNVNENVNNNETEGLYSALLDPLVNSSFFH